jgi:hypothetical protein
MVTHWTLGSWLDKVKSCHITMILVTHQESDYDGDTVTPHMSRKHNVIKQKTKTQLVFNISQREIKELYCPVSIVVEFTTTYAISV